ncbi:unnamed protein product [Effrenium voratum]|uniref:Bicarbonate transporter-like transmembrane domain-containing protein n=1 Tax=Effrenium voratum TaxID=2562239 RepID=A0AA36IIM5_9DINO|nr:unnamed protein product [Effrenium voratum]
MPGRSGDNILCAVLALVKELDRPGLELVRRRKPRARLSSAWTLEAEAVIRNESGYITHTAKKDFGPLEFTGKIGGGLRLDLRRRAPLYISDWTDAFKAENFQKSVSSILYLFIAALAPAITFGSIDRQFPAWGIAYAIIPSIGFAVLGYLDQNLTSIIVNRPSNGLKKAPGYHLDLFVRGALTLPACAVLGLPLSVASTVPSITHVISLTTYEVKQLPQGETKVPSKVVEQRATNFLIHVLIGCALFMAPVLKFLPRAVLQGVFFYMGIASLTGNNLFDRLFLWMIWDSSKYPQYNYIQKLPIKRVHLYTFVQVVCLAILYGLKAIKETSVVFPFFMASLAIIRKALKYMFTAEELQLLDRRIPDARALGDSILCAVLALVKACQGPYN